MPFLMQHNLLPYLAIVIMSIVIYFQFQKSIEQNLLIKQQEKSISTANETMGIIQTYNEERFSELEKVRKSTWKKGKHEGTF